MSARCCVAIGPGRSRVRSRTRIPESGFARKLFDRLWIGAAHPAADARVGAADGADPGEYRGQVPGAEADQRVVRIEAGDDHLADFALRYGLARARTHDLEDQRFVEDHAFERLGLVGDKAEIR